MKGEKMQKNAQKGTILRNGQTLNGGTGLKLSRSWRKWDWYAAHGILERTRLDRWPPSTIRKLWITSCLLPWCP